MIFTILATGGEDGKDMARIDEVIGDTVLETRKFAFDTSNSASVQILEK